MGSAAAAAERRRTAKLTHEQVKEIRKLAHADTAKVAERFGVQPASIANIWNGRTWVEEVAQ
jgi:DNA-binding XRE family transcriptional regulator